MTPLHGVGRVRINADLGERRAVEHAGVSGAVNKPDGEACRGVEVSARGMTPLQQGGLVVAARHDPRAGGHVAGAVGYRAANVGDRADGVRSAIDVAQARGVGHEVEVGVDEAGDEGASLAVHDARALPAEAGEVVVAPDPRYRAVPHRDRGRAGQALVERDYVGVSQHVIGPCCRVVRGVRHVLAP